MEDAAERAWELRATSHQAYQLAERPLLLVLASPRAFDGDVQGTMESRLQMGHENNVVNNVSHNNQNNKEMRGVTE